MPIDCKRIIVTKLYTNLPIDTQHSIENNTTNLNLMIKLHKAAYCIVNQFINDEIKTF